MVTQSPVQRSAHSPVDVPLVQYRDGSIYAMSLSQPGVTYLVQLAPVSCTCPGFGYRGQCCHVKAALARFAPACYWCGAAENVAVYTNHGDHDAEITLCGRCFDGR